MLVGLSMIYSCNNGMGIKHAQNQLTEVQTQLNTLESIMKNK